MQSNINWNQIFKIFSIQFQSKRQKDKLQFERPDITRQIINFVDPTKTRSKLNLPNPLISGRDIQEATKIIRTSEMTKQVSRSLREQFHSLPHPRNDYEIILSEENMD